MSERMQNILVGFTAMLAMAGLAMLLMLFGYMPRMLEEGYRVKVDMSDEEVPLGYQQRSSKGSSAFMNSAV